MDPPASNMDVTATELQSERISLAGTWQLLLDRDNECTPWPGGAQLPGSLAVQRIGDAVTLETKWTGTIFDRSFFDAPDCAHLRTPGRLRIPFWLQPDTVFVGRARYEREIDIPESWRDRRIVLFLERTHWETRAWLDGNELGTGESLSVPHEFELIGAKPGTHRLMLEVDNRLNVEVGENAHSVTDHTQGNWNGVIGRLELRATPPTWIADLQVYPSVATRTVRVRGWVRGGEAGVPVTLAVPESGLPAITAECGSGGAFAAELALGDGAPFWNEFSPVLHTLRASVASGHVRSLRFGLREITVAGGQMLLNGLPIFLRGTVDCCCFPQTGHPPMDVASWRRVLETVKAHGLNHVRFHSWCPPEAAFDAADEMGVYLQIEAATWPNSVAVLASRSPSGIGDGQRVDAWTLAEAERIVRAYGNHASFLLMAAGNEPGGPNHAEYLAGWVSHMRAFDRRRLYTGAAGWPELPENQFQVIPEPRSHQWGDGLSSRMNALPPATTADYRLAIARRTVPVVAHEAGQWCSYPPLHDAGNYRGHLHARNFEAFADSLAEHHAGDRVRDFVAASGRLQALCYKEEIESALRTPGLGGFQLLGLQDFPGQGTAPVGILNAFGQTKGYVEADAWRRHCGPVVLLARLAKRVFTVAETLDADLEIANFGPGPLAAGTLSWKLLDSAGGVLAGGLQSTQAVPIGNGFHVGRLAIELRDVPAPQRCRLSATMEAGGASNEWDVWIYPRELPPEPSTVGVTSSITDALALASGGGRVLLTLPAGAVANEIRLGFTPIFWNTSCTQGQAPHTLGILCDPEHPALEGFPTDFHSNWQWWYLVTKAAPLLLDSLPATCRPVIEVIDDWFTNRRLGLLLEARVGTGRLLLCSIDLRANDDPVTRQLRHSLVRYLDTVAPDAPACVLTPDQIMPLLSSAG